jgi:hypothetical protein
MGMAVTARNTRELGEPGLEVRVAIPLADAGQAAAGADAPRIR